MSAIPLHAHSPVAWRSIAALVSAEVLVMSLWFVSAALLPEMQAETALSPARAAALTTAVQIGFVVGALILALDGTSDRHDPRCVFVVCAFVAAASNATLVLLPAGDDLQIALRCLTGDAALAGGWTGPRCRSDAAADRAAVWRLKGASRQCRRAPR